MSYLRNLGILVAAPMLIGLLGYVVVSKNPGRDQLRWRRIQLDAMLVQKRAIARNLALYRRKTAYLEQRLDDERGLLQPDLEALRGDASRLGYQLEPREKARTLPQYDVIPVRLTGGSERLPQLIELLERQRPMFTMPALAIHDGRVEMTVDFFQRHDVRAEKPEAEGSHWYDAFNDELRKVNREKETEVRQLDRIIGEVGRFTEIKRELESILEITTRVKDESVPLQELVTSLVATPDLVLRDVSFVAERDGATIQGTFEAALFESIEVLGWKLGSTSLVEGANLVVFQYLR